MDNENTVYCLAAKKNEIINFADTWVVLDEVTQTQTDQSHMFSLIESSQVQTFRSAYISWNDCRNQERNKGLLQGWGLGNKWQ